MGGMANAGEFFCSFRWPAHGLALVDLFLDAIPNSLAPNPSPVAALTRSVACSTAFATPLTALRPLWKMLGFFSATDFLDGLPFISASGFSLAAPSPSVSGPVSSKSSPSDSDVCVLGFSSSTVHLEPTKPGARSPSNPSSLTVMTNGVGCQGASTFGGACRRRAPSSKSSRSRYLTRSFMRPAFLYFVLPSPVSGACKSNHWPSGLFSASWHSQ
mmetsp:Transcript_20203/g.47123  ORF Transcript_20203/g.47123 Transcript_20203/m.47123 type:complete len:215 (+) Transcript_20203:847-1491(+)